MKKAPYTTVKGKYCDCAGCTLPAYSQMFICAIDKHVLLCKECDQTINEIVVKEVFGWFSKEAYQCNKDYALKCAASLGVMPETLWQKQDRKKSGRRKSTSAT